MTETRTWNLHVNITSEAAGDKEAAAEAIQTLLSDYWYEWLAEAMGIEDSEAESSISVVSFE